jgi:hypothetical protein
MRGVFLPAAARLRATIGLLQHCGPGSTQVPDIAPCKESTVLIRRPWTLLLWERACARWPSSHARQRILGLGNAVAIRWLKSDGWLDSRISRSNARVMATYNNRASSAGSTCGLGNWPRPGITTSGNSSPLLECMLTSLTVSPLANRASRCCALRPEASGICARCSAVSSPLAW